MDALPWASDAGTTGTTERMSECDSTLAPSARIALQHRVLPLLALAMLEAKADRTQGANHLDPLVLAPPPKGGQPLAPALLK